MDFKTEAPPEKEVFGPPPPETPRNPLDGLTFAESAEKLKECGENIMPRLRARPFAMGFSRAFRLPETALLLLAAAMLHIEKLPGQAGAMLVLAALSAAIGFVRAALAAKCASALKPKPKTAVVRRSGRLYITDSAKIVPGDVVYVKAGDAVPADIRLFAASGLEVDESTLTGVNAKCVKSAPGEERDGSPRDNMLFAGTYVLSGWGEGFAVETGRKTALFRQKPKLARREHALAERALSKLWRPAEGVIAALAAAVALAGFFRSGHVDYCAALALAGAGSVGFVPCVRVALARASVKMREGGLLIQSECAAYDFGAAEIVCAAKSAFSREGHGRVQSFGEQSLLANAVYLCNDARVSEKGEYIGDSVDIALRRYAEELGVTPSSPRVGAAGFERSRAMMSTVHAAAGGVFRQYTKGAPGAVLERCGSIYWNGRVEPLTDLLRERVVDECCLMAEQGLLTVAGAWRDHENMPECTHEELEKGMTFIGVCGISDPLRAGVSAHVERAALMGVKTLLVTGGHPDAACAAGNALGIFESGGRLLTGENLAAMDEYDFDEQLDCYAAFSGAAPRQRAKIARAHVLKGRTVISTVVSAEQMARSRGAGTSAALPCSPEIAKDRAGAIVESGSFAAIASAIAEGRGALETVRRALAFSLGWRLAVVLAVLAAVIFGQTLMSAPALALLCLLCEGLPATALMLGGERADGGKRQALLSRSGAVDILWQGALIAALGLYSHRIGGHAAAQAGAASAFITLSLGAALLSLAVGAGGQTVLSGRAGKRHLIAAIHAAIALCAVYLPGAGQALGFSPPDAVGLVISAGLAALVVPVCEFVRRFERRRKKGGT